MRFIPISDATWCKVTAQANWTTAFKPGFAQRVSEQISLWTSWMYDGSFVMGSRVNQAVNQKFKTNQMQEYSYYDILWLNTSFFKSDI